MNNDNAPPLLGTSPAPSSESEESLEERLEHISAVLEEIAVNTAEMCGLFPLPPLRDENAPPPPGEATRGSSVARRSASGSSSSSPEHAPRPSHNVNARPAPPAQPAASISPEPSPGGASRSASVVPASRTVIPREARQGEGEERRRAAPDVSASREALHQRRAQDATRTGDTGLLAAFKNGLDALGDRLGGRRDTGELQDAAGLAVGGPLWSAFKEVKEAVVEQGEDAEGLLGWFRKSGTPAAGDDAAADPRRARRDARGRFLRQGRDAPPTRAENAQLEIARNSLSLATQEAREDDKRQEELISAIRRSGERGGLTEGGGLSDRFRGRRRTLASGGAGADMGVASGRPERARPAHGRTRAGRRPRGRAGVLVGGAAALGGLLGLGSAVSGEESPSAAEAARTAVGAAPAGSTAVARAGSAAERGGSLLGRAAGVGSRGLAGAARAIPVAGQILAAGLALYDGAQGWNDADMQREAFGLKDGEEATTGQKASTAAANVLDMGGLLTGAAGLVGFDVNPADMARGLYSAGEAVSGAMATVTESASGLLDSVGEKASGLWHSATSFFGSEDSKQKKSATSPREMFPEGRSATMDEESQGLFGDLTAALSGLTEQIREQLRAETFPVSGVLSGVTSWAGRMVGTISGALGDRGSGSGGGSAGTGAGSGKSSNAPVPINAELGAVIAKYESGSGGSRTIGYDHTGGTSYGKYQLSTTSARGGEGSMQGFLRMMEAQGGEQAAIAQRIRAAGPLNTGSRGGAAAEQWKKEVAANPELMEKAQRDYMVKSNYSPAMHRLNPELREKVQKSKALQEALFSTAVQHGGAGGANVFNNAYRSGMSEEEFINAMYDRRGNYFRSSSAQVQSSVRNRFQREKQDILAMRAEEKRIAAASGTGTGTKNAVQAAMLGAGGSSALNQAVSASLQGSTQDAMNRGVRYQMAARDSSLGKIDCSGWVTEMSLAMMRNVNEQAGKEVFSKQARAVITRGGTSEGIIQSVGRATGEILTNEALSPDKVREGMLIGMDTGPTKHDRGRQLGIDHIVQTFRDPKTGRMMVSESTGAVGKDGRNGVRVTDYEEWYARQNTRAKLFGVDPTRLADAQAVASLSPQAGQATGGSAAVETPDQQDTQRAAEGPYQLPAPHIAPRDNRDGARTASGVMPTPAATVARASVPPAETRYQTESLKGIAQPPTVPQQQEKTDFSMLASLLERLISVVEKQGQNQNTPPEAQNASAIPMDYADPYLLSMAHDVR